MFHVSKKRIVPDAKQTVGNKQKKKSFLYGLYFHFIARGSTK